MITHRRILQGLVFWVLFLAAHAWGQPHLIAETQPVQEQQRHEDVLQASRAESGDRLPDHVYKTLVALCRDYPEPVVQDTAHIGAILNRVAWVHRAEGWGLSRKTGGTRINSPVGEIAEDILQLPDGRHYDVLIAAGRGLPLQPSQGTNIGIIDLRARPWVAPVDAALPWGTVTPNPPTPTPPPTVDLTEVLLAIGSLDPRLRDIEARLIRIEAREMPDVSLLYQFVDDMIGDGPNPGDGEPNHVTDIKERLDAIRADVRDLVAWLRSRGLLRY